MRGFGQWGIATKNIENQKQQRKEKPKGMRLTFVNKMEKNVMILLF